MAYPGTYNFSYYRGDTLEFKVYPKNTAGAAFSLADYDVNFTIAAARGGEAIATPYAAISADSSYITCVITPSDGNLLSAGTPYVYDVEINYLTSPDYPRVYTLLTGDITVQEQVTNIDFVFTSLPNAPTDLIVGEVVPDTIGLAWTAPADGDPATSYNLYAKSTGIINDYTLFDTTEDTTYSTSLLGVISIADIPSGTVIDFKVTSVNEAGENTTDFAEGSVTLA